MKAIRLCALSLLICASGFAAERGNLVEKKVQLKLNACAEKLGMNSKNALALRDELDACIVEQIDGGL